MRLSKTSAALPLLKVSPLPHKCLCEPLYHCNIITISKEKGDEPPHSYHDHFGRERRYLFGFYVIQ